MKVPEKILKLALHQETLRNLTNEEPSRKGFFVTAATPCSGARTMCFPICTRGVN